MRLINILCCAVALAAFTVPTAHADEWNKKTFLTFSGPVQLPGTTLAPGTYMFRLADLESNRHIVQVFDKDGGKILATLLTIPNYRLDTPEKNIVMFGERPSGTPQAVKAWWYPGDKTGEEFVYPKSQAVMIARSAHEPVLAMEDDTAGTTPDSMKGKKVGRVNASGKMTAENPAATSASATAPATSTETAPASTRGPSSAVGTTGQADRARTELPRTASTLPLVELLSVLAFAGFLGMRQLRKRLGDHA